ncbi:hypothetical protein UA24_12995 [Marinomonas sp. BSi20414]|nr:hypothetical protein [Marinomonas sp. BSi20414]
MVELLINLCCYDTMKRGLEQVFIRFVLTNLGRKDRMKRYIIRRHPVDDVFLWATSPSQSDFV